MSWFDDICDTVSSSFDAALDLASSACETAKDAGEWAWDHREGVGDAVEIAKDIIDWIPDDAFDR